jgi:hypothetical protein
MKAGSQDGMKRGVPVEGIGDITEKKIAENNIIPPERLLNPRKGPGRRSDVIADLGVDRGSRHKITPHVITH